MSVGGMVQQKIAFELKHITKLYAGTVALEDVSISVNKGEVHGIIGKNGAGKSTLVGILSGIIQPSMGEIIVNGHSFHNLNPIAAKKQHISIITQEPQVITECSAAENLFMPHYSGRQIIPWAELIAKSNKVLQDAGFPINGELKVRDLSVSEKQLLLVVKSCYVENADIIIMDEVSASLTQRDENTLYSIISERKQAGKTVIFISHHTSELLKICDRVSVLRDGHSIGCYNCSDLDMRKLAALIVGDTDLVKIQTGDQKNSERGNLLFELKNFTHYGKFQDINLKLYEGEIVGLAGLRGSGRTELFKSIVGIDSHDRGSIFIKEKERNYHSPAAALVDGVMYMAEERETEGLIPITSIKKNLTISILPRISIKGILSTLLENEKSDSLIKTLDIKTSSRDQEVSQLSGGNKQKVLVGKIMAHNPVVSLLDEPTRGVDVGAKESILNIINEQMRKNSCVMLSTPGVDDLLKICDRILILYDGRLIDEFNRDEFNEQDIYRAMQGEIIHANRGIGK